MPYLLQRYLRFSYGRDGQTCINICLHDALKLSFKLNVGGKELMDYVPPKRYSR